MNGAFRRTWTLARGSAIVGRSLGRGNLGRRSYAAVEAAAAGESAGGCSRRAEIAYQLIVPAFTFGSL